MNRICIGAALLIATGCANAALQPGDIAFTSFNADEDGFSIAALRDVAPYTTVYFSDNEWSGGAPGVGAFNGGENTYAWISGEQTLAAGSVVRFNSIDKATRAASIGAFGLVDSGAVGFSASGDTIFAFLADVSTTPTRFLAALSSENWAGSLLDGTGLSVGVNAVAIGAGADYAEYDGIRGGLASFGAYAGLIADATQWRSHASGEFATLAPNMASFGIAPVPEPQTYALLLSGLLLVALRLRQRRQTHGPRLVPS